MPKICIDCKHYSIGFPITHLCARPGLKVDLVTGEALNVDAYKERAVSYQDTCGPDGSYWEPNIENVEGSD